MAEYRAFTWSGSGHTRHHVRVHDVPIRQVAQAVSNPHSIRYSVPLSPPLVPRTEYAVIAFAIIIAFGVAAVVTGWFASRESPHWFIDHPNERSLHDRPMSRAGGIAIFAGISVGFAILAFIEASGPGYGWILIGAILIACVSFADDIRRVSPMIRIVFHLAAGVCIVFAGLPPDRIVLPGMALHLAPAVGTVFTVLFVAWFVNLYNFMDGIDGSAGGMTVIGFTTLAVLCAVQGAEALAAANLVVAAASLGFLLFNFPPARIFMGDLGSTILGYACAATMLYAERSASIPLWISCLVFSPFIVDASVTLARRIISGQRPWHPHREHFYQRLVRLGWGHRKTAVRGYGLMLACACSATAAVRLPPDAQGVLLGVWVVAYLILMHYVAYLEREAKA